MISNDRFLDLVQSKIGLDLRNPKSGAQLKAIDFSGSAVLQIVAGPGSGKTTVLVLRALRFVFVEGVLPENVVITTFTRPAARELRTRWLDWGSVLYNELETDPDVHLGHIDLNRCTIDTLDSVVQQALTDYRLPGTLAPVVADSTASGLILKRSAFRELYEGEKELIDDLLSRYTFEGQTPRNRGEALRTARRLLERLIQDRVDLRSFGQSDDARSLIVQILTRYRQQAIETNVFDFALLEEHLLERLREGTLDGWLNEIRVILIDEYQDTNPLQEAIYFQILSKAQVSMTIVGDDDQSMYRFRGGSVELFTDFSSRCQLAAARETSRVDMVRNFRSRPEIVVFYNDFITGDPSFQAARITPPKPLVAPDRGEGGIPVLGIFRQDSEHLAVDVSSFLARLIEDRRISVGGRGEEIRLGRAGALGDAVFLAHSIEEARYNRFNGSPEDRFPGILRRNLESSGLEVFNPRGQALRSIRDVGVLLGLLLLAVDPLDTITDAVWPTREARFFLQRWRRAAEEFVRSNPAPNDGGGLGRFIEDWQAAAEGNRQSAFPREWPVVEVAYKLICWLPGFQAEPEHQVWLESIMRIIDGAGMASPYEMRLLQNTPGEHQGDHVRRSRESLVRDALLPIAEDEVEVDETIIPSVPRNTLQFMTIHQAKGLEFPLVIVDVGSSFTRNHRKQSFLRFPQEISSVVRAEEDVEPFLASDLRGSRGTLDRTFDDLVRLYYVAYSRPQSVLILVGNERVLQYGRGQGLSQGVIPSVALGWRRDRTWPWRQEFDGQRPPVRVEPPLLLI